ncbi:maleylacetoacetate isomerase [soil metagenome]
MTQTSGLVLYNYFRSSCSYRVRIALNFKSLPFEYRAVHLVKNGGEQYLPDYLNLNPSREVPTLLHGKVVIAQSLAILDYLENIAPTPRLYPRDPATRALVIQACEIVNSGAQPPANLRVTKLLAERFGATDEQKLEWTKFWVKWGLETLEAFLKPIAGKYSVGDTFTAADCCTIPMMFGADRFGVPTDSYPTLLRVTKNGLELDAVKKASPSQQPDFPKT